MPFPLVLDDTGSCARLRVHQMRCMVQDGNIYFRAMMPWEKGQGYGILLQWPCRPFFRTNAAISGTRSLLPCMDSCFVLGLRTREEEQTGLNQLPYRLFKPMM